MITNVEEHERARREVARLCGAGAGTVDAAVYIALIHAITVWERRLLDAANLKKSETL